MFSVSVQNCSVYVHLLPVTFKTLLSCDVMPDFMEFVNKKKIFAAFKFVIRDITILVSQYSAV